MEYTIVHGRPSVAMGAADDVVSDGRWVRLRYICRDGDELLARIADENGVITLDCSLFVQIMLLYDSPPEPDADGRRVYMLGTGVWAMRYLAGRDNVCALVLPSDIYERVKWTNTESAQWLIRVGGDIYYGLANMPMRASLADWRAWLRGAFAEAANALSEGDDRDYQLELCAGDALQWSIMHLN